MTPRQFLYRLLPLLIVLSIAKTTADPDLWGHVRFGQDILEQHTIKLADRYSFTSDRPWVNHEWLAEIAMAGSFRAGGAAGLQLLRIGLICGVLALVWLIAGNIDSRQKILVTSIGAIGLYTRALPIRPQLFSLLFFALLLTLLELSEKWRSAKPLAWVPIVMAVWANIHGGWIVGLAALACWCLLSIATSSARERLSLLAVLIGAVVATLANPYGVELWRFLESTVRLQRPLIGDWQPLYVLPYYFLISWGAALALSIFAVTRSRGLVDRKRLAITVMLALVSIRVSRLDAFFAIAAMFLASDALRNRTSTRATTRDERAFPVLKYAYALCVVALIAALIPRLKAIPTQPELVPDSQVAAYVHQAQLRGNALMWFDWGEYAIWHFGPDLKVSIDGRRETVYSAALVDAHMRFYFGHADAARFPDAINADYVWIPRQLAVVRELERNGWTPLCEGSASILLARNAGAPRCEEQQQTSERQFPD